MLRGLEFAVPIFDYSCDECKKRFELIIASIETKPDKVCPQCGSSHINRLISRFRVVKSMESRLEDLADPSRLGDLDENNPESMIKWAKKLGHAVGEDLGDEIDSMVEEEMSRPSPDDSLSPGPDGGLAE